MSPHYKNKDLLKIHPFYRSEIENNKRKKTKIKNKSRLPISSKKLSNIELSKVLPFLPEKTKRSKRLTKYQILSKYFHFLIAHVFQENNMLLEIMQELMSLRLWIVKV